MNTDNAVAATVSGAAAILAGLDPAFQHDQFLIGMKLAVADKRTISDAQGRPLLIVTSPSRLGRLVLGLLTAFLVFMLLESVGVVIVVSEIRLQGVGTVLGLVAAVALAAAMVALMVFQAILGRPHYRFLPAPATGKPLLRMQPETTLGFSTWYTLLDADKVSLGQLHTNHLANAMRTRWYAHVPDGTLKLVVEEDSKLPGFVRRPLRGGVGMVLMLLLLGAIGLVGYGHLGIAYLVLFGLFPLTHLVFRWLLPNCVYFKPDRQSIVGVLRRDHQAPAPRHLLDLSQNGDHYLDPRVALALAVVLFEQ
jgi:hypothetical protein